jgi:hypothetical protein
VSTPPVPGATDYRPWRWRNLRDATVTAAILVFPWQWRLHWERVSVYDEFHALVLIGPLLLKVECSYGNCSTGDWRARFGMSDLRAWERSERGE